MLSTPRSGWSKITIGEWSERCSYLDDVPFMLLESLELSCRTHTPQAVKFDAEGWDYIIVFDWMTTYVISDKYENAAFTEIRVNRDELAKELMEDIGRDVDAWSAWGYDGMSDDQMSERKADLLALCEILERRIPSDDWRLVYKKDENKKMQYSES